MICFNGNPITLYINQDLLFKKIIVFIFIPVNDAIFFSSLEKQREIYLVVFSKSTALNIFKKY